MSREKKPFRGFGLGIMRRLRGTSPPETDLVIRECRRLVQGGVFLDIGANVGYVAEAVAPHAGRMICVEPDPLTFAELTKRMGARATCVQALVGPEGAERVFLRNLKSSGSSTSVSPEHDPPGHTRLERSSMRSVSLDRLTREHGRADFIKIDVEGGEIAVLESGPETLAGKPVVLMEFNTLCLAQFGRINPRDAIEYVLNTFPKVERITPKGRERVTDGYQFLSQNLLEYRALDNLVCSWG